MKPTTDKVTMPISAASEGNTPPAAKPRPVSSKSRKNKKKSPKEPMSGWGCLWRSIVFTLILFAAYVFFGLLLEALQ